jgi:hypothetical protein
MEPSSLLKVTGAFAAGVILALGGALFYRNIPAAPAPLVIQNPPAAIPGAPAVASAVAAAPDPPPPVVHPIKHARPKPTVAPIKPIALVTPTLVQVAPAPLLPPAPVVSDPPPPVAPVPHVVTLASGTNLVVRLTETVSTDHNYTGDTFRGTLDVPIILDGFIIADKGSKVLGKIASAQKAELRLTVTEINTTDGQRVPVETSFFEKIAPARGREDAAKIGGGAALGAIIGAIAGGGKGAAIGAGVGGGAGTGAVLLGHGKPALLPAETRLTFQLSRPATITEKLN